MTVEDICRLGDPRSREIAGYLTPRDAFLWLWVTNPILLDGTGARVCRAWGFEPSQLVTWVKGRIVGQMVETEDGKRVAVGKFIAQIGMGHLTRGATEHMILATRGRTKHLLKSRSVPNVFIAPRTSHSTKPQAAYDLIQRLCPGPYLEMFARRPREGWTVHGDQSQAVSA
jgi:N6-adenosine-specific RNA methylase IME4